MNKSDKINKVHSFSNLSDNRDAMLNKSVSFLVIRLAIPSIISMLVISVYSMADMFFVSKLGISASAAVGIVFSIMTMTQAVGNMFGIGAGSLISIKMSENNSEEADQVASVAFFLQ